MQEYRKGQDSEIFKKNQASNTHPKHLSFSVYYTEEQQGSGTESLPVRTLDIVCKDHDEFMTWSTGLLWLIANKEKVRSEAGNFASESSVTQEALNIDVKKMQEKMHDHFDLCTWGDASWGQLGHTDKVDEIVDVDLPKVINRKRYQVYFDSPNINRKCATSSTKTSISNPWLWERATRPPFLKTAECTPGATVGAAAWARPLRVSSVPWTCRCLTM